MTENLVEIAELLETRQIPHASHIVSACSFLNAVKLGNPCVKFILLDTVSGYLIQPVVKIKMRGQHDGRSVVRTVVLGRGPDWSVFPQVLSSFGISSIESKAIYHNITTITGRQLYFGMEKLLQSTYMNFIQSDEFQREFSKGRKKKTDKLRTKMREEIISRFRIMLSLGEDETGVVGLFRQAEIERVLGS